MKQTAINKESRERIADLFRRIAAMLAVPVEFPPDSDVTDDHAQADAAQGEAVRLRGHVEEGRR